MHRFKRELKVLLVALGCAVAAIAVTKETVAEEVPVMQLIHHSTSCYVWAMGASLPEEVKRHGDVLKLYQHNFPQVIAHDMGYTKGYIVAVSLMTGVSIDVLSKQVYTKQCGISM